MKGFLKVTHYVGGDERHDWFIPVKSILLIQHVREIQTNHVVMKLNYPVYVISIKNIFEEKAQIAKYVVDRSEDQHVERIIAGTDDALFDYVELLKYMPSMEGSETKKTRLNSILN